jgi:hypothetical protein
MAQKHCLCIQTAGHAGKSDSQNKKYTSYTAIWHINKVARQELLQLVIGSQENKQCTKFEKAQHAIFFSTCNSFSEAIHKAHHLICELAANTPLINAKLRLLRCMYGQTDISNLSPTHLISPGELKEAAHNSSYAVKWDIGSGEKSFTIRLQLICSLTAAILSNCIEWWSDAE